MLDNEYTEEFLQKINKPQLITTALSWRVENKATIEFLKDEVKEMNSNFKKIEVDVSIVKKVNHQSNSAGRVPSNLVENVQKLLEYQHLYLNRALEKKSAKYLRPWTYQLTRMILKTAIGFKTRNERFLSFFDARTSSKFIDAKKISEAST